MKRHLWLGMASLFLAACIGCATPAAPEAALPTDALPAESEPTPMEICISVAVDSPTEVPTPSPTPEPQGEPGVVMADGVGIIYALLSRGATVAVSGEQDEYYTATADGINVLVEKRLIRLESAAEYETWTGYAKSRAPVYASYQLTGEAIASLKSNTKVTVLEDLGDCYLIEWEGTLGYASVDRINKKKATGGGGGGDGGGSDGGDIHLSQRRQGGRFTRLGIRSEAAAAPQNGTVLADQTEAYIGCVGREDTVLVVDRDETYYHVLFDGKTGLIPKYLVRLESDEPYVSWQGYAESKAPFYGDYRMKGEAEQLKRNTVVTVLADLESCYQVEVDGKLGYIPKEEVSEEKVKKSTGGGSGGEWTEPVL